VTYFAQTARMALDVFGRDKQWLDEMDTLGASNPIAEMGIPESLFRS
jgi:hypothetical protein